MTTSESHFRFAFKLEETPDGRFVAHSEDPPITVEAPTRAELEKKLEEKVKELLASDVAGKLQLDIPGAHVHNNINFRFHVNRRNVPGGTDADTALAGSEPPLVSSTSDTPLQAEKTFPRSSLVIALIVLGILALVWLAAHQR